MTRTNNNGRGGRRWNNNKKSNGAKKNNHSSQKKDVTPSLKNQVFKLGTAKQANEHSNAMPFIINHVQTELEGGCAIAAALEAEECSFPDEPGTLATQLDGSQPLLGRKAGQPKLDDQGKPVMVARWVPSEADKMKNKPNYDRWIKKKDTYDGNKAAAYSILWKQCDKQLQSKIKLRAEFDGAIKNGAVELKKIIKMLALDYEESKCDIGIVLNSLRNLLNYTQKDDVSLENYNEGFKAASGVAKQHLGGELVLQKIMDAEGYPSGDDLYQAATHDPKAILPLLEKRKKIKESVWEKIKAYLYYVSSNQSKYGSLAKGTITGYAAENVDWPTDISKVHDTLQPHTWDGAWKEKKKHAAAERKKQEQQRKNNNRRNNEITFATIKSKKKCYCCGEAHPLSDCPHRATRPKPEWHVNKMKELQAVQVAFTQIRQQVVRDRGVPTFVQPAAPPSGGSATPPFTQTPDAASVAGSAATNNAASTDAVQLWQAFGFATLAEVNFTSVPDELKGKQILGSASSIDLVCNPALCHNIRDVDDSVTMITNGGPMVSRQMASVPNYRDVWFNQDAVTSLFSAYNMQEEFRLTFDSAVINAFVQHTPRGKILWAANRWKTYERLPGYYEDDCATPKTVPASPAMGFVQPEASLISTVAENESYHPPSVASRAQLARTLAIAAYSPSDRGLAHVVGHKLIANCPVRTEGIHTAKRIYGPDLGTLRGKTTRSASNIPRRTDVIHIPKRLLRAHQNLELYMDGIRANGIAFLTCIARHIRHRMAVHLQEMKSDHFFDAIGIVLRRLNGAGFTANKIHCGPEFKPLFKPAKGTLDVALEFCPPKKHVPEAERNNRALKERLRSTLLRLPFCGVPKAALIAIMQGIPEKINCFPQKDGIPGYTPRVLVDRKAFDYNEVRYAPLTYVAAHDDPPHKRRVNVPRTISGLYLRPAPNGPGYEVLNLDTNKVVAREKLAELPITAAAKARVNELARQGKQAGLQITDLWGNTIHDEAWIAGVDSDANNYPEAPENEDESDDGSSYASDSDDESAMPQLMMRPIDDGYSSDEDSDDESDDTSETDGTDDEWPVVEPGNGVQVLDVGYEPTVERTIQAPTAVETVEAQDGGVDAAMEEDPVALRRSARATQPATRLSPRMSGQHHGASEVGQQHLVAENTIEHTEPMAKVAALFVQRLHTTGVQMEEQQDQAHNHLATYSLKKGLAKFKERGEESATKEMKQLHDRGCWEPIHFHELSMAEKKKAMEPLIFLVEKPGKVKPRHCANGSTQRPFYEGTGTSSPTVPTESVMLASAIEASEGRKVATIDVPNAFCQTPAPETDKDGDRIVMKIRGPMVGMLINIAPDIHLPYATTERGQKVACVRIKKAIYGMLLPALWYYQKWRTDVESCGFTVNPYDSCVANKMVNGKQLTITWHVDDVKASHMGQQVLDEFVEWVNGLYGAYAKVTMTKGAIHVYLGMALDYSTPGEVKIDMRGYARKMIEGFPKKLPGTAATPANDNLFKVMQGKPLNQLKKEAFHTFTARALFLTKRARPDILPTVGFLCTRVKEPNEHDWAKLTRLMDFLQRAVEDCLTLRADSSNIALWSVDAAFAVHHGMRSHTGATMTLGKGAIQSASSKQKLNTRSSTEAELVAVDDAMAQIIWADNFLRAQGYNLQESVIQQGNQSAIKLEENGMASAGKRSRHIDIRYYFVAGQIKKGRVNVKCHPTDEMQSDYMPKTLQGKKFLKHRKSILNLE